MYFFAVLTAKSSNDGNVKQRQIHVVNVLFRHFRLANLLFVYLYRVLHVVAIM